MSFPKAPGQSHVINAHMAISDDFCGRGPDRPPHRLVAMGRCAAAGLGLASRSNLPRFVALISSPNRSSARTIRRAWTHSIFRPCHWHGPARSMWHWHCRRAPRPWLRRPAICAAWVIPRACAPGAPTHRPTFANALRLGQAHGAAMRLRWPWWASAREAAATIMGRLRQAIKSFDWQGLSSGTPVALRIGLEQMGGSK